MPFRLNHFTGNFDYYNNDHSSLINLLSDDHTQYLLADGSRDLAGHWSVANYSIRNIGYTDFTPLATPPAHNEGRVYYCDNTKSLCYYNDRADITVNIGRELLERVKNKQGSAINNGDVVYNSGSTGDNPEVKLARADFFETLRGPAVVTQAQINNNAVGYVTTYGRVRGINTTGSSVGESWVAGDVLWVHPTTAGKMTKSKPVNPNLAMKVGIVIRVSATQGAIFVDPDREVDNFTEGSIVFAGSNGEISQDNANLFWDDTNNRLGIGTNSPIARLHLPAGTTTVAPIKIEEGNLLSTPEAGTIEFSNDRFYITDVDTQRAIDRTSDVLTETVTVSNTTTETTVYTGTIDPGDLRAGNRIKVDTDGVLSTANASQVLTIRIYLGTTLLESNVVTGTTFNNEPWELEAKFTVRSIGVSGQVASHTDIETGGAVVGSNSSQSSAVVTADTTLSEDITVTAQWDAADPGNSFSAYQGTLEYKN